jgi:paired amphipathic helix protein Sin3a
MLFKDAPDLLSEFKDFLPDAVPANIGPGGVSILPLAGLWESSPPNASGKKFSQASKRNRKRVPEKDSTPVLPAKAIPSRVCTS